MKVFVAGATGAIGRRLVPLLLGSGHEVVAMTRSREKERALRELGAEPVVADGLDRAAVLEAVRTDGTDHLLEAARAAGARRFVAQSFGNWNYERTGFGAKREEDPFDPAPPARQRQSLAAIRHVERAVLGDGGVEGVVLRYANLYGPGTGFAEDGEFAPMLRARRFPVIGEGGGVWSFVHVDDAATATAAAIERGAPGAYNIADDDPAAVAAWLPELARALGARAPRRVPVWLGRLASGEVGVSLLTRIRGASNAKARRELGWRPAFPTWREGFRYGLAEA